MKYLKTFRAFALPITLGVLSLQSFVNGDAVFGAVYLTLGGLCVVVNVEGGGD